MAAPRLCTLIGQIEQLSSGSPGPHGTDRQLLDDFSARHDEAAFAELVARHGSLVLRVCRRVLHHEQDAEDAFQATFLVLAQNLGSIRKREALADWLHGVAYRTAMKAKRSAARRRNHETQLRERTPPASSPTWGDVQAVLDEEIQRLPEIFRPAFVLCVLEGKTTAAAAVELVCKDGTVGTRVMRARQRLQKQLSRRGIKLASLLAALCVAEGVAKAVPAALGQTVIRNGLLVAASGTAAGTIPPRVATLAAGVSRTMFLHKAKIAVVVLLTLSLIVAGAGVLTHQLLKAEEKPSVAQPAVKSVAEPAKPEEDIVEVVGRVLDPDGKSVANARLYQPRWLKVLPFRTADFEMVSLGTADAEGRFRVKLPHPSAKIGSPFTLIAAADGFGLNWIELSKSEKPDDVTLRLVKDQVVRGRLVNTEGKPVAGVTVEIFSMWTPLPDLLKGWSEWKPVIIYARLNKVLRVSATDKDGRFEIAGLGADRAVVAEMRSDTAVMPAFTIATREGYDPKRQAPRNYQSFPQPWFGPSFECAVLPAKSLEGTVREAGSHKPVVGAVVEASARAGGLAIQAVTDSKGHYRLTGLIKADQYYVEVSPGKMAPYLTRSVEVADRPGLEAVRCDVELSRGVIVTGRVVDKVTGKGVVSPVSWVPLPDNPFAAKLPARDFQEVWTDTEGRFSLVTIPGPGVLLAQMQSIVDRIGGVNVVPYKQAEFDEADRKRIKIVEKPVSSGLRGNIFRSFTVAGGGLVYLNNINACKVVDLKEDSGPVACDLTLDPGKTLTINLEDPDGKPLVGAMAAGVDAMGNVVWQLKTAACPVYALDPKQPRQLGFLHAERKLAAIVTLRGDDKEPYTVRLTPTSTITGRLLDPEGQPFAGAYIHLSDSYAGGVAERVSGSMPQTRIDKDGRFRLEGLVPGIKVQVRVIKGNDIFVEESKTNREAPKAGAILDVGDIRVKPRSK